ncbi:MULTISPECIES: DUF3000 domain-containing protein [unclassified Streptomyces]|uniref:DUF3000 domain-containing protein n=1 Tax=unclassified Streptomyces TaxID=2593676 RepID=UPI0022B697C9|nr:MULTISPECIES: DUF3000 domain-containing protein [unclassified Streptomyces]MCZ7415970.1 DUF3000 domain-containing protein [Streptomyces sp. WMMC897]MCZ7434223.1 DUF3000 domain-containing protein [Streptomyces sp. WMMC1477]
MAAAREHQVEGPDDGDSGSAVFQRVAAALTGARVRQAVRLEPLPAPRRLAPHAHALGASVIVDGEELADGRFVLLHDPGGQEGWQGTFRVVTLTRAELESEMAADPLLPEVTWSWLIGALEARGLPVRQPGGTVTRAGSCYFGELAGRPPEAEIELRASWTPLAPLGVPDVAAHLQAWCDLLCQCAGLPPEEAEDAEAPQPPGAPGVVSLPQRRGPRSR